MLFTKKSVLHLNLWLASCCFKMANTNNYFAHAFLDKGSEYRKNKDWILNELNSNSSIFVLFHIDKPFVKLNQEKQTYELYKLNNNQIKTYLQAKCTYLFMGIEYTELNSEYLNNDHDSKSPYTRYELYKRDKHVSWFAIDTQKYEEDAKESVKMFPDGIFLEQNLMRMLSINNKEEASIISQVLFLPKMLSCVPQFLKVSTG